LRALRDTIIESCDLDAIRAVAESVSTGGTPNRLPPLGQRIAVARDEAFGFSYPHMLNDWREQGAEISFFSPLADESPSAVTPNSTGGDSPPLRNFAPA